MDELRPGLRQQLEGRRGRFVRVVEGGSVAVGDAVQLQPPL
jgi:MOSC domain-containing protein YiiM